MGFGQIFVVVLQSKTVTFMWISDYRKKLGNFLFMRVYYFKIFSRKHRDRHVRGGDALGYLFRSLSARENLLLF